MPRTLDGGNTKPRLTRPVFNTVSRGDILALMTLPRGSLITPHEVYTVSWILFGIKDHIQDLGASQIVGFLVQCPRSYLDRVYQWPL